MPYYTGWWRYTWPEVTNAGQTGQTGLHNWTTAKQSVCRELQKTIAWSRHRFCRFPTTNRSDCQRWQPASVQPFFNVTKDNLTNNLFHTHTDTIYKASLKASSRCHNIALHASPTARNSAFLISAFLFHWTSFFSHLFPVTNCGVWWTVKQTIIRNWMYEFRPDVIFCLTGR